MSQFYCLYTVCINNILGDKGKSLLESVSVRNVTAVLYGGPEVQKLNNDQTETGKVFAAVLFPSTTTMTSLFR